MVQRLEGVPCKWLMITAQKYRASESSQYRTCARSGVVLHAWGKKLLIHVDCRLGIVGVSGLVSDCSRICYSCVSNDTI